MGVAMVGMAMVGVVRGGFGKRVSGTGGRTMGLGVGTSDAIMGGK